LSARTRFIAHTVVVGAAVATSVVRIDGWLAVMAVVALVWIVNLYNFMDGSNGLAGGMTVFGFATYAIVAAPAQPQLAIAGAAVAGAGLGFLVLNFHPARIFLGDSGSIPLGFLAGTMGFWGWQHGAWPIWFPALAFAPFFADATVTLLRRLARGEKVWKAHREHYYQRLVQLGATHVRVALFYYFLMLIGSSIALFALHLSLLGQWLIVGGWYFALAIVGLWIDWRWRGFRQS
jgi:UDP-N-acetylmuramyl pentapeptide phosphotransferase/UDP-N-acetylglucosamine-1-phosphate transferase